VRQQRLQLRAKAMLFLCLCFKGLCPDEVTNGTKREIVFTPAAEFWCPKDVLQGLLVSCL
jgi:hypothetical protein